MMKTQITMVFVLMCLNLFSQNAAEVCESDHADPLLDLNSITKCVIKKDDDEKEKKVTFQVTSRRRLKRKRNTASSVLNNGYAHKISEVKKNTNFVNSLAIKGVDASGVISFYKVDEIPLFKECEDAAIAEQGQCFKKQISRHVKLNLKYPKKSYENGIQGRVLANFLIDKNGKVNITNTLFPYKGEELREEAKRIINKLPQFIPGKQGGVNVNVQYTLRVMFQIPGVEKTNIRPKAINVVLKTHNLNEVDKAPAFKDCDANANYSSDCFIKGLQKHVTDNFAYPVDAINNNIEGTVSIKFIINTKGQVANIITKGSKETKILEIAAKRLIEKLPVFTPAMKDNTAVNLAYEFPIKFSLND